MRPLTSLDLRYVLQELNILKDGKLQKVYQFGKDHFSFNFHVTGKGKQLMEVFFPSMIYLSDQKLESAAEPPHFCMVLRKNISGARIIKLEQVGFERILKFVFGSRDRICNLYIELFSTGNMVLCDKDDKIISLLYAKRWKDRTLRGGVKYELPPTENNILEMDEKSFETVLKNSGKDQVVKALATDLSFGGAYSEEIFSLAGLDKSAAKLSSDDTAKLYKTVKKILDGKPQPLVVTKDNTPVDAYPFPINGLEESSKAESFSSAIQSVVTLEHVENKKTNNEQRRTKKLTEMEKIIEQQTQTVGSLKTKIADQEAAANFIYEHYAEVDSILKELKEAKKKHSMDEIKERLKGHKKIKSVDTKEKTVTLDL